MIQTNKKASNMNAVIVGMIIGLIILSFSTAFASDIFDTATSSLDESQLQSCDVDDDNLVGNDDICPCNPQQPRGNGYVLFKETFIDNLPEEENAQLYTEFFNYQKRDQIRENSIFWEKDVETILKYVAESHKKGSSAEPFQDTLSLRAQDVLVKNNQGTVAKKPLSFEIFCPSTTDWNECTPERVKELWFQQRVVDDKTRWEITCQRECTQEYVDEKC